MSDKVFHFLWEVAPILNEQQATISDLKDENEQLKEERNYFERKKCEYFNKYNKKHLDNIQLKEENEQLKKEMNEQQSIIHKDEISINTMMSNMKKLEKENKELQKDKEILKERLRECRIKMDKFNCR